MSHGDCPRAAHSSTCYELGEQRMPGPVYTMSWLTLLHVLVEGLVKCHNPHVDGQRIPESTASRVLPACTSRKATSITRKTRVCSPKGFISGAVRGEYRRRRLRVDALDDNVRGGDGSPDLLVVRVRRRLQAGVRNDVRSDPQQHWLVQHAQVRAEHHGPTSPPLPGARCVF